MEKIAINPNRLKWCMNTVEVDLDGLSLEVHIAKQTLEQVMENQEALSVNQLEKIANYFKRSLLFFLDPNEASEDKIYSPQFRTINNKGRDDWSIPKKQKRAIAKSLSEIEQQSSDRDSAIKAAYATGVYSQREIGEHFRLHPSTVGVIVRRTINS